MDRLLGDLRREGTCDSTGSFTLHLARGRAKMALFQQAWPAYCFVRWYQAFVALGAREVEVTFDGSVISMRALLSEAVELEGVLAGFEARRSVLGEGELLLLGGLLACSACGHEVMMGDASAWHIFSGESTWRRRGGLGQPALEIKVSSVGLPARTVLDTLAERVSFSPVKTRMRSLVEEVPLLSALWLDPAAEGWWQRWTRHYVLIERLVEDASPRAHSLAVRGTASYTKRPREQFGVYHRTFVPAKDGAGERTAARLLVSLPLSLEGVGRLYPVQWGVTLDPVERDLGCPGVGVVVSVGSLKTDLSGLKLVEGEASPRRRRSASFATGSRRL